MSEELLDQNVTLWSHAYPREAIWLQYVDTDHLQLEKTDTGFWNLVYENDKQSFSYHSQEDPLKEAYERMANLDLEHTKVVYIYGVGLGYDFLAAKDWLEKDEACQLIFLEDDLAVVYRLFETEVGKEILTHKQVQLSFIKDLEQTEQVFNELFWHFHGAPFEIVSSQAYQIMKPRTFDDLKHKLTYDLEVKKDLLQEYMEFGMVFFRNFYLNVQKLDQAHLGNKLFGKFKNIPAIICGAGPSLQKNIEVLKTAQNRALIFGGSSSLNALDYAGVKPHFGVGIDPNSMQANRYSKLPKLEFPFFFRQRLHPDALAQLHGPRLYITGTGGYDIADWFEKRLGIEGEWEPIEEGHNVVTFSLEIAHSLGCNPIIFVGMDLGYTDLYLYPPGVISESKTAENNTINPDELGDKILLKEDIYGKPLYTLWKWISESKWISDFAEENSDVTLINATEGGLGFEGVSNVTLTEVISKYLKDKRPLHSLIDAQVDDAKMPQVTNEKIVTLMRELKGSLQKCINHLQILNEENEKVKDKVLEEGHQEQFQTGKASLVEIELAEEQAFPAVLEIFNSVYTHLLDREIKELSDPAVALSEKEKDLKRIALNNKKYNFLSQVAQINLMLLEFALSSP